ncbi:unnamed protein product, partial [marine sediment metagenome]
NKAKLRNAKMNVSLYIIKDYEQKPRFSLNKNKAKTNPNPKMNINFYLVRNYENKRLQTPEKQSQTNPIKTSSAL